MICRPCSVQKHDECTNPPTCPCQHKNTVKLSDGSIAQVREDGEAIVLQKGQIDG